MLYNLTLFMSISFITNVTLSQVECIFLNNLIVLVVGHCDYISLWYLSNDYYYYCHMPYIYIYRTVFINWKKFKSALQC